VNGPWRSNKGWRGRSAALTLAAALLVGCQGAEAPGDPVAETPPDLTLLALGDSYTVGHSLPTGWSWPWQLADSLAAGGDTLEAVAVVARTGWTTRDLLDAARAHRGTGALPERRHGLVTLMIGVNNQFQGLDIDVFRAELDTLVVLATELAGNKPRRVVGFTIPDYGVTPVGSLYDADRVASEIAAHNSVLREVAAARGIALVDITPLSCDAGTDPALVARDGLHYSRAMYARWVSLMLPVVRDALGLVATKG